MRKSDIQRSLALAVMLSGVLLGVWISSGGISARAQDNEGGLPPPMPMELPPDLLPPDGTTPFSSPAPGPGPAPEQDYQFDESQGLQLEMPQDFNFTTVNPEGFLYNPEGLRDPFFPLRKDKAGNTIEPQNIRPTAELEYNPQDPLQAFLLAEYRLVGVMWDVREPRAMVLTPDGRLFTVKNKIRLGREGAVIAAIRESEIVVAEPNSDGTYVKASTRVITMKR